MIPELLADWAPGELTRAYWESAARGELVVQRCGSCGHLQHPPRPFCTRCTSAAVSFGLVSGDGSVYSFTVVRRALLPELRPVVPYILALVELDEGVRLTTLIRDCDPEAVTIGMRVSVAFEVVGPATLPVFRPQAR